MDITVGMYTQIKVDCALASDVPADVVQVLQYLASGKTFFDPDFDLPNHEFFKCDRWKVILCMSSAYFDDDTTASLVSFDGRWRLLGCANLKNYGGEIAQFFDWLQPYVDADVGDAIGCYRYEEDDDETFVVKLER
jgi:hypothetical protein